MVDTWVVFHVKSVQVVNINRKHFMMGLGQWDFTPDKVKCAFHPILVTSFLVVLAHEVTKVLCNSLFTFHYVLPNLPRKGKTSYKNHAT